MKLLLLGVLVHLVLLYSIFDIYFKSPITHGAHPVKLENKAPAKRLVLFVADGLRADKFFTLDDDGRSRAPFLRNIIENEGTWGVSHTRMPTESRPGHVALIAGFYEDVSAVARGWKENPVEFDSVFNQTKYTWSWGSPDILPMFAKGASGQHVYTKMYEAENEEFSGSTSYKLDTWVFNKFKEFLKVTKENDTLNAMVHSEKVVFFLHLLGLDTNGHSHKPNSHEYLDNIKIVDKGISEICEFLKNYFHDDQKTAFIMTSDHGMTDWGSHGAGDPEETFTPFVAWGAGIRKPLRPSRNDFYDDQLDFAWNLSHVKRVDLNQVDVAPLMSSLIGCNIPMNSMGIVPVDILEHNWKFRSDVMYANFRQLLAQYHLKQKIRKDSALIFRPFKEFNSHIEEQRIEMIQNLLNSGRYEESVQVLYRVILLVQKGIDYYNRYDGFLLKFLMTSTYISWMVYLVILIIQDHSSVSVKSLESQKQPKKQRSTSRLLLGLTFGLITIISFMIFALSSPALYYVYYNLPIVLWSMVIDKCHTLLEAKSMIEKNDLDLVIFKVLALSFLGLEILVLTFFKRTLLSLGFVFLSTWTHLSQTNERKKSTSMMWSACCIAMAIFPLLPTVGKISAPNLVAFSGWLLSFVSALCARRQELHLVKQNRAQTKQPKIVVLITAFQIFLLFLSTYITRKTASCIEANESVPILNHILSWIILLSSFILPLMGSSYMLTRLLNISCSLVSVYLLLSSSYEGVFILTLLCLLFVWLLAENEASPSGNLLQNLQFTSDYSERWQKKFKRNLCLEDIRRAYFFIYFIIGAFFCTGNIASLNSFDVSSVFCFITVFNPFVMGGLLLLKVLIPFIIVASVFRSIHLSLQLPTKGLLLIVLLMTDFMSLHFFFLVRDSGSWLDIGTSISHYVIVMTIIISIIIFYALATFLTSFNISFVNKSVKLHRM